jgi:hypothetical protein
MRYESSLIAGSLCLALASPCVESAENAAMVVAVRGDVIAISEADTRPLKHGQFTATGEKIVTSSRSFAVLQFFDGSKVSLRPDSSMLIEEFHYSGDASDFARLYLVSGTVKTTAGAIVANSPDRFRIRVGSSEWMLTGSEGTMSVCGTEICEQTGVGKAPD